MTRQRVPLPKQHIILTPEEWTWAAHVGADRQIASRSQGLRNQIVNAEGGTWGIDILGAAAELALCKLLGVPWQADINTFKAPDVCGIQVRATDHRSGRLKVRREDAADEPYLLMVQDSFFWFRAAGWAWGHEAQSHPEWFYDITNSNKPPAYWMPQNRLRPFSTLKIGPTRA